MARVRHFTLRTAVFLATLNWTVAVVAQVQRFEQGGVALEVSLNGLDETKQLVAGSDAIAKIRISDSASGAPLPGSAPKAWVLAQRSGPLGRDVECADKVRALASGSFGAGADRDLNSYHLLTLNSDKTISVINPQISFSSTKLENLIVLPGNGADWVLSKDKKFLYVSIPGAAAIVIIDTSTRRIISQLSTGDNSAPTQIVLQPDGRIVWVGLDGSGEIVAVDTSNNAMAGRIKVGNGLHKIVFSADSRNVFVSNSSDDTVSIIDSAKMQSVATLIVAKTPVALSYGSVSHLVYAGGINAEIITAIDADARRIVAEIPVKRGISVLRFEPTGRFAFAINQLESNVSVIDSATSTITSQVQVVDDPDQITFTRRYAYIRGLGSEKFTLLDLNEIRAGKAAPVDIQAGPLAPSVLPEEIGSASMIAAAPDGSSVMIASAPDATIYYYQEGMMAASRARGSG